MLSPSRARVQLAATAGIGSATTTSALEQLRETLGTNTVPDLIEKCQAAGISGYSNKRKDELIDLLVRKKPRLDEQVLRVHSNATGLRGSSLFGLCLVACTALSECSGVRDIMQAHPPAPPSAAIAPIPVAMEESMVLIARMHRAWSCAAIGCTDRTDGCCASSCARRLLHVLRCTLSASCCMLHVVCCFGVFFMLSLRLVWCMASAACRRLSVEYH
jgi:hypothetical protein